MFIFKNRSDRSVVEEVEITLAEFESIHDGDFKNIFQGYDVSIHIPVWID